MDSESSAHSTPKNHELNLTDPKTYVNIFNEYSSNYMEHFIDKVDEDSEEVLRSYKERWMSEKRQKAFQKHVQESIVDDIKALLQTIENKNEEIKTLRHKIKKERDAAAKAGKVMLNQSKFLLNQGAPTPKRKKIDSDDDGDEIDDEPAPKRKKVVKLRDENKPKGVMTSFMAFIADSRETIRAKLVTKLGRTPKQPELMKELGSAWKDLTASEDAADVATVKKYQDLSDKDRKRYKTEMAKYVRPSDSELMKRKAAKKRAKKSVSEPDADALVEAAAKSNDEEGDGDESDT